MPVFAYGKPHVGPDGRPQLPHGLVTYRKLPLRQKPVRIAPARENQVGNHVARQLSHGDPHLRTAGRIGVNRQLPPWVGKWTSPRIPLAFPLNQASSALVRREEAWRTKVYGQGCPVKSVRYIPIGGRLVRAYPC